MIAIMILGIGIVMVATVFPVGLEISRQPIQTYLAMGIADAAAATLKTKVPAYRNLDIAYFDGNTYGIIANATHRVLVPDVTNTDLDTLIDDQDAEVLNNLTLPKQSPSLDLYPVSYFHWGPGWMDVLPAGTTLTYTQPDEEFFKRTRVFTERTGWAGEHANWSLSAVVQSQNLPADPTVRNTMFGSVADLDAFLNAIPLAVHPTLTAVGYADLPRVNLVDQVYPPVTLQNQDGSTRSFQDTIVAGKAYPGVLTELLSRQYAWAAVHHRMSTETAQPGKLFTNRDIIATIATLHRTDVGSRFARQRSLDNTNYLVVFDLNDDDHQRAAYRPNADPDPATDAIFPRPWLVMLKDLDASNGRASCSHEVARILPAGSSFIIARNIGNYSAGTYFQVVQSRYDPALLGSTADPLDPNSAFPWTSIDINRANIAMTSSVPVWVFPPAVTNLALQRAGPATYDFHTRSPVVGLDLRRITVK